MQQQSSCFILAVLLSCVLSTVLATPIPAHATASAHSAAAEEAAAEEAEAEVVGTEATLNAASGGEDLAETEAPESSDDTVAEGKAEAEEDDRTNDTDHTAVPGGSNAPEAKSGKHSLITS